MDIIKGSSFPIVITGLDPFDSKFSSLRKMCELIEFKPVPYKVIAEHVQEVLQKEGRTFAVDAVLKIAMGAGGDMRAAINDAQSLSSSGSLTMHDVALLGDRDKTETMQHALLRVFKAKSAEVAKGAFDNVDEDIDKILLWVDHNLPTEYKQPLDRKRAFDALADADIFLGRIRRWQHYRFYVYAYDFLSVGVAVAKDERYPGVSTYVQSDRILKIWLSKQKFMKKQAIAEKMALRMHGSIKRSFADVSFVQQMFLHNKQMAESLSGYFDLDKEEVAWLKK
jgi:replication factor C large subunit